LQKLKNQGINHPFNNLAYSWEGGICLVQVSVRDNNVEQALRALKKKLQREGVFREMKIRKHYEKPSEKKKREASEAVRRWRKMERKRRDR
jgi:small subunit ribosomal protein S21